MSGRKWREGNPHIEFRCAYCSDLVATGTVIDGAIAVVSWHPGTEYPGAPDEVRRGWIVPPSEHRLLHATHPAGIRACRSHDRIVDPESDSDDLFDLRSSVRINLGWDDVALAVKAFVDDGRVGVVRVGKVEGKAVSNTHNEVRARRKP